MSDKTPRTRASVAAAGLALGAAAGWASLAPQHAYLFGMPTVWFAELTGWILRGAASAGLPLGRAVAVIVAHAAAGVVAGAIAAGVLAAARMRERWLFSRPIPLGVSSGVLGAAILGALWLRRGIGLRPLALLAVALLLAVWSVVVVLAASSCGRWVGKHPRVALGILGASALVVAVVALRAPRLDVTRAEIVPTRAPRPLLLIGVDAASWANLEPLLAEGRLPNLARLRSEGASGDLDSIALLISPPVWITIVTGEPPSEHGIVDFVLDGVPYTSNSRRAQALWEVLPRFGQRSAFHYWWASWPAEHVGGRIVTDRFEDHALTARVHPEEETRELDALAGAATASAPPVDALLGPGGRIDEAFRERHRVRLQVLRDFIVRDEVVTAMGESALASQEFDLVGVYLRGPDAAGHKFWKWHYHGRSPRFAEWLYGPPDPDQAALEPVVDRMNERIDAQVGRLLSAAGPDTNVVIVSDHGMRAAKRFERNREGASADETGNHHRSGLVLLAGPDIRRGARLGGASVYDVFPTILHLLGLPVPEDIPGRVWVEALADDTLRARPLARIVTLGERSSEATEPIPTELDADYIERLKALGYIGD